MSEDLFTTSSKVPLLSQMTTFDGQRDFKDTQHSTTISSEELNTRGHLHTSTSEQQSQLPGIPHTYRRRYLILFQLSLLNILVSWSWLTFAPVSATTATFFGVTLSSVNWLSTGFLFAFVVATPFTLYTLNRFGPRGAIIVASVLVAIGSWVRYAGTRVGSEGDDHGRKFGVVVLGQVLIGLAQPFVLAAPTRFSEMWFTEKGRIAATAVASLANPFGGAVSLHQCCDTYSRATLALSKEREHHGGVF
jgi:FLVCR family MFS transporter 7